MGQPAGEPGLDCCPAEACSTLRAQRTGQGSLPPEAPALQNMHSAARSTVEIVAGHALLPPCRHVKTIVALRTTSPCRRGVSAENLLVRTLPSSFPGAPLPCLQSRAGGGTSPGHDPTSPVFAAGGSGGSAGAHTALDTITEQPSGPVPEGKGSAAEGRKDSGV